MPQNNLRKATLRTKASIKGLFCPSKRNNERRKTILTTIFGLMVIILAISIANLQTGRALAHSDSIAGQGVGIYWDQGCTNKTLTLYWTQMKPGSNNTLTVYVRNECNTPIYLWITTQDWTPSNASDYINLTWNYSSQILTANQVIPIELTLSVSQNITGITQFSFSTTITAAA
ncbi:MAG TPA: hypothetical protein VMD05_05490 [Candidatus Nanoarchaeia archaeon]|nr:hypothetical protein [Candidatus Nanoarchaeia archaeon]